MNCASPTSILSLLKCSQTSVSVENCSHWALLLDTPRKSGGRIKVVYHVTKTATGEAKYELFTFNNASTLYYERILIGNLDLDFMTFDEICHNYTQDVNAFHVLNNNCL
eukprot:TRINITY_DN7722_c0_g1_i1.p1 TRINITY_DN7722_c0_g1~~TRINITY_DN7722_c0_g1_i1.p1  ORF type:complete len:109 (-),score=12.05 TRINITY_DN7722_c0_g1_i1:419-745(-)